MRPAFRITYKFQHQTPPLYCCFLLIIKAKMCVSRNLQIEKTTKGPDGKTPCTKKTPSSVHPSRLQALAKGKNGYPFVIVMLITSGKNPAPVCGNSVLKRHPGRFD